MKPLERTVSRSRQCTLGLVVMALAGGCAVEPPVPTAVTISPGDLVVNDLETTWELTAIVTDQNGHAISDATVTWASRDTTVATVSATGVIGVVTPVSDGSTVVEASVGAVAGTAPVTVQVTRAVLLKFYEALDGPGWTDNTNWGTDAPLGTWHGVETDSEGRVTGLRMRENGLTGRIPPEVGLLKALEFLNLARGDSVSGLIPPELGNLWNLQTLDLQGNYLTGSIPPELGNLQNLTTLSVIWNELTGSVPPELGNLQNLRQLFVAFNQLTGSIPPELGNLENLGSLLISGNQLTGSVPPELGNLSLSALALNSNELTGSLPRELIGMPLRWFYWDETDLCASLDDDFQKWLQSIEVHVRGNNCSGAEPG